MDGNELRDNAEYIGNTSFAMKVISLKKSIEKCIVKCEEELDDIYEAGMANSREGKLRIPLLERMIECYEMLYNIKIASKEELAEVDWMFNKGALREEDEILMFCESLDRKTPKMRRRKEEHIIDIEDRVSSIMRLLPFIVASTIAGLPFILASEPMETGCFAAPILTVVAFGPCWLIFHGIKVSIISKLEHTIYKERKARGERYTVNPRLILDVAVYAAALGITFKKSRKK